MYFVSRAKNIVLYLYIMDSIKNRLSSISSGFSKGFSGSNLIICLLVSVALVITIKYVWDQYISPKLNASYVSNKEFIEKGDDNDVAEIYFFYTEWCPHCKKARPEWDKFKDMVGENKVNNTNIYFYEIDCDKDTATANKFKVEGYPTIKMTHKDQIYEYDAKPDANNLQQFVNVSLN